MVKKAERKKLNPYNSYIFLSLCALSLVKFPNYALGENASIINTALVVGLTTISLFFYIKNFKASKMFMAILLFWGIISISTVINSGDYVLLMRSVLPSLLLCMTLEGGFRTNRKKTIRSFALVWGAIAIANSLSMFLYYSPNFLRRGMYMDNGGNPNYYLLGQDNGTIFYTVPATIMVVADCLERKKKISKLALFFTFIQAASYYYVFSGAGIIIFTSIILIELLMNNNSAS